MAHLAAVVLAVVMAAVEHRPFLQELILPWYGDHTAGQTGRLQGGRGWKGTVWRMEGDAAYRGMKEEREFINTMREMDYGKHMSRDRHEKMSGIKIKSLERDNKITRERCK